MTDAGTGALGLTVLVGVCNRSSNNLATQNHYETKIVYFPLSEHETDLTISVSKHLRRPLIFSKGY